MNGPKREVSSAAVPDSEFGALFRNITRSAWRLELLPVYRVAAEERKFNAYLSGEPVPPSENGAWWELGQDWRKMISEHRQANREFGRVHVLPDQLTPYLRYEIDWGYSLNNAAGDDIRLVAESTLPSDLKKRLSQDFWLFDDETVVLCDYDPDGKWIGARRVTDLTVVPEFLALKNELKSLSMDFRSFMQRYRQGEFR